MIILTQGFNSRSHTENESHFFSNDVLYLLVNHCNSVCVSALIFIQFIIVEYNARITMRPMRIKFIYNELNK